MGSLLAGSRQPAAGREDTESTERTGLHRGPAIQPALRTSLLPTPDYLLLPNCRPAHCEKSRDAADLPAYCQLPAASCLLIAGEREVALLSALRPRAVEDA